MDNLFSLAQQMAENIPEDEREKIQNMDMNDMIQHVTKNVMTMMNDPDAVEKNPLLALANNHKLNDNNKIEEIVNKSNDLHFSINLKLEDLYKGKKKSISVKRNKVKKVKTKNGKHKYESKVEKKTITIPIEPGTVDQQTIIFEGEADEVRGEKPGDIIVTINEIPHDIFEREGDNLFIIKDISLSEAFDYNYNIKHLDGHILNIKNKENDILYLQEGVRKIEGEGMPVLGEENTYGDLFIRFNLILPEKVDPKYIPAIKEIFPQIRDDSIKNEKITIDKDVVEKVLNIVTEEEIDNLGDDESDFTSSEEDDEKDDEEEDLD